MLRSRTAQLLTRSWRAAPALISRLGTDSLLRNSLYIMSTTVVNSLVGYLFWIVAAHTHTAHDVGLAAALISAVTIGAIVSGVGINSSLIQILPSRPSGRPWSLTLNAGLCIGVLNGLLAGVIGLLVLQLFSSQFDILMHGGAYTVAFVVGVPLWSVIAVLDAVYVAERAAGKMLLRNSINALLKPAFLPLLVPVAGMGALAILGAAVLATAAGACAGMVLVTRLGRRYQLAGRGLIGQAKAMVPSIVGHHLITMGGLAPVYVLPTLVTARLSATENAYFYTTWMVGGIFFTISPSVSGSLFAEGSHAAQSLVERARSSVLIICALLGPVAVLFLLGGRYVLGLFGPEYARHGLLLLTILIVATVPDAITNVCVAVLRVRRRLGDAAWLNMGMAAITLVLAWLLLPPLGIAGAGVAWLAAQTAGSIGVGIQILRASGRRYRREAADRHDDELSASDTVSVPVIQQGDG